MFQEPNMGKQRYFTKQMLIELYEHRAQIWKSLGISCYYVGCLLAMYGTACLAWGLQMPLGWPFLATILVSIIGYAFMARAGYWLRGAIQVQTEALTQRSSNV